MAAVGLHCCVRAFSSCGKWEPPAGCGVLTSHCGDFSCGAQALELWLTRCGAWASLLLGMWDLPGPGIKPMFPALAGGFLTIGSID